MNIPVVELTIKLGMMGKVVCFIFLGLSLWSWALVLSRVGALGRINGNNKSFRKKFKDVRSLPDVDRMSPSELNTSMGQLAKIGADEYHRIIADARSHTKVKDWSFFLEAQFTMAKERISSALAGIIKPFDRGVYLLAMISSISPFLGLLGTVWGITNSFYDIGKQGSAALQVVAPGIAEALITTIAALVVAIPALFFYNYCNKQAERAADDMEEFSEILTVRLRREIFSAFFAERQQSQYGPA
jgi:biopolymer transport protein TolQ